MDLILDDRSDDILPGCMLVKIRNVQGDKLGPSFSTASFMPETANENDGAFCHLWSTAW